MLIYLTIDEAKPQCKRCQKAKLKCEGYSGISIIQYERKDRARPQGASGEMALSVSSPKSLQAVNHIQSEELFGSPWLSVLQDDIFISYTLTRLLGSPDQEAVNVTGAGRSLTEVCFLALSTTYFGVEHGERSVVQRGLQQYSHALKLLNQALGNASRHSASDVLDAVTVVTLYEVSLLSNISTLCETEFEPDGLSLLYPKTATLGFATPADCRAFWRCMGLIRFHRLQD